MSASLPRALRSSWTWLLMGALLLPFASSQTVIPAAAWLAPVCLLRFTRNASRGRVAWGAVLLAYAFGIAFGLRNGLAPLPLVGIGLVALVSGLFRSLAYVADRTLAPSLAGIRRSLVFPAAMTGVEWVFALLSPYGSWGSSGYSQAGNLPLLQILSVTGLWGLTFLIHWLAPVVDALLDEKPGPALRPAAAFGVVLAGVLLFGGTRLAFFPPRGNPVPVAAVSLSVSEYDRAFAGWKYREIARASLPERTGLRPQLAAAQELLLARTQAAAQAGARIVSWPESTPVLEEDLDALLEKGGTLARRERLHLVMTPWVIRRTGRFPFVENLSVLVDPEGRVRWRYPKTYPVLGIEEGKFGRGPGIVPQAEIPSGRLASVICQDLDFPGLVRQAGRSRAGLLIGPADDWPAVQTTHAQMAVFRAIENGTSLLRPTNNGISLAVDPQGRILGATGSQAQAAPLLLSALPLSGTTTLYSLAGDWFAYVCLAGLGAVLVIVKRNS
ncbi:MAG TPA: nitrilase-related carbon-nitrogen hydrolase [Thermoanaerobaculia bacterium]|nr:nitrilase-related carbon-nitrogen hydrolase [Thermoanaerobaculia bacterium]